MSAKRASLKDSLLKFVPDPVAPTPELQIEVPEVPQAPLEPQIDLELEPSSPIQPESTSEPKETEGTNEIPPEQENKALSKRKGSSKTKTITPTPPEPENVPDKEPEIVPETQIKPKKENKTVLTSVRITVRQQDLIAHLTREGALQSLTQGKNMQADASIHYRSAIEIYFKLLTDKDLEQILSRWDPSATKLEFEIISYLTEKLNKYNVPTRD